MLCFPLLFPISIEFGLTGRSGHGFAMRLSLQGVSEQWPVRIVRRRGGLLGSPIPNEPPSEYT